MRTRHDSATSAVRPTADLILPAQYHHRPPARPEESLMLAILEDALACMKRNAGAPDARGRRIFREAHHWIHCGDRTWPFSFENICHTLDIDASYVRGKVRRWLRPVGAPTRRQMTLRMQSCTGGAARLA